MLEAATCRSEHVLSAVGNLHMLDLSLQLNATSFSLSLTVTAVGAAGTAAGTSTACLQCAGAPDATTGADRVPAAAGASSAETGAGGTPAQTHGPDAGATLALPGAPVAGDEMRFDVSPVPRYCARQCE